MMACSAATRWSRTSAASIGRKVPGPTCKRDVHEVEGGQDLGLPVQARGRGGDGAGVRGVERLVAGASVGVGGAADVRRERDLAGGRERREQLALRDLEATGAGVVRVDDAEVAAREVGRAREDVAGAQAAGAADPRGEHGAGGLAGARIADEELERSIGAVEEDPRGHDPRVVDDHEGAVREPARQLAGVGVVQRRRGACIGEHEEARVAAPRRRVLGDLLGGQVEVEVLGSGHRRRP
jgi:hypothetical protein